MLEMLIDKIELAWKTLRAEQRDIIAKTLPLSEEEGQKFWPLYNEYEASSEVLDERAVGLISEYVGVFEKLSDEQAKFILDEALKIRQERLEIVTRAIEKFEEVLPFIKVFQFYQVVNKVEAFIEFELATQTSVIQ